ncbi:hypothetical protein HY28_005194 [Salmonella enterica subsp. enterica]|nr:hypothetical protein [Salmonella enterica subsp. enterica serovar Panama]
MEKRIMGLAVVVIAAFAIAWGYCSWQIISTSIADAGGVTMSSVMISLFIIVLMSAIMVPVIFALQPLLMVAIVVFELSWQLVRGIYLAVRYLSRRRTHA